MAKRKRKIRIGFDLDGVIIGKPPLIPRKLIEWLYRSHKNKKLGYRIPGKFERAIRWASHHPLLRPPIKENLLIIKKLSKDKRYELYAISSRFGFLEGRTHEWFKKYGVDGVFKKVYLNTEDKQPHEYKVNVINKLKPDCFVEDDLLTIDYLRKKTKGVVIAHVDYKENKLDKVVKKTIGVDLSRKPRILVGITYYYPNVSGLTSYVERLAEGLMGKGFTVTVLTSRHDSGLEREEEVNGVRIIRSPVLFKIGKGVFMPLLPIQIFTEARKTDVINCHLPQFESFLFAIIGKLLGKKIVFTHHTDLSGWSGLFNRMSEAILWTGQIVASLFADKIIPYTKDYAEHSWYLRLFRRKLDFVYPPIQVKDVNFALKKKLRRKIGRLKLVIGFSGRIAKQKGIPHLLNAIPLLDEMLDNYIIVFAGPYEGVIGESYYKDIKENFSRYSERFCFLGNIKLDDISTFYSLCDVLVLPSDDRLESFGVVQVEAMLNGCPVVASDLPGVRIPITKTKMGTLVRPGDSKELAGAIVEVIKNRNKFTTPKSRIKEIFDYSSTIDFYEKLFIK